MNDSVQQVILSLDQSIAQLEAAQERLEKLKALRTQLLDLFPAGGPEVKAPEPLASPRPMEPAARRRRDAVARGPKPLMEVKRMDDLPLPAGKSKLTALHPKVINAGRKLREPFDAWKLQNAAAMGNKNASNAITRWLAKGWIHRAAPGEYVRTATFGENTPKAAAAAATNPVVDELAEVQKLHQQIRGEVESASQEEEA